MRKVGGEHPFCVLIYMNSYIFHICFILFILLSYLTFDFVCLTLSSADTHGIAKYARTYTWDTHTGAHTQKKEKRKSGKISKIRNKKNKQEKVGKPKKKKIEMGSQERKKEGNKKKGRKEKGGVKEKNERKGGKGKKKKEKKEKKSEGDGFAGVEERGY